MAGKLKITLVRSKNHRSENALRTLESLGLKKIGTTVTRPDNPQIRGMVKKLAYMLKSEEA